MIGVERKIVVRNLSYKNFSYSSETVFDDTIRCFEEEPFGKVIDKFFVVDCRKFEPHFDRLQYSINRIL